MRTTSLNLARAFELKDGKDATIIATGLMVGMALEAAKCLKKKAFPQE